MDTGQQLYSPQGHRKYLVVTAGRNDFNLVSNYSSIRINFV